MGAPSLTLPSHPADFPVILFGLECRTTAIVLTELIEAGLAVSLVCLPGRPGVPLLRVSNRSSLPMAGASGRPRSVAGIAGAAGVEVWRVGDLNSPEVHEGLPAVPGEMLVVACYDRLLTAGLYADRRHGGVNIHPSLLPDKRGPDPLFWVFREGDDLVGTTLHRLTDAFDGGDILAQEALPKPDGITEEELDGTLSRLGARLLLEAISHAAANTLVPRPQTAQKASWAPFPSPADYQIDRTMDARHAFNFVRGVSGRSHPVLIDIDGRRFPVLEVHGWLENDKSPAALPDGAQVVEFAVGWLALTLGDETG